MPSIDLSAFVPGDLQGFVRSGAKDQEQIPALAKGTKQVEAVERAARKVPTHHVLFLRDSRRMDVLDDESVHLIVTSPPYWTLKEYPDRPGQLGRVEDYEQFLDELDEVWRHCLRVLVPGGRLIIVVGDVCLPRRRFGRHVVVPLHASIQERCRRLSIRSKML